MGDFVDALIIPPYGYIDRTSITGTSGQVTLERINEAARLIATGTVSRTAIIPFPQKKGLGVNVVNYLKTRTEFGQVNLRHMGEVGTSWGTWEDTLESLGIIYANSNNKPVSVHFVSDAGQLGRLWIIWHFVSKWKYPNWKASFHAATTNRNDSWRHEPRSYVKLVGNVLMYWGHHIKVRVATKFSA